MLIHFQCQFTPDSNSNTRLRVKGDIMGIGQDLYDDQVPGDELDLEFDEQNREDTPNDTEEEEGNDT